MSPGADSSSSTLVQDMTDRKPGRRYRFGAFEADAATGELRRKGLRIKLNAQPFQVLLMLMDRAGELVTREEISRELWPDGTFVDYEHGVNSAVNRIREALSDTAGNSRFVETLARRGYRFIAPIEVLDGEAAPSVPGLIPHEQREQPAHAAEPEPIRGLRILATAEDLPKASHALVQTLYLLLQLMYVGFYVGALANLAEIEDLLAPLPHATAALNFLIVLAAILLPVRAFVICAALFHAPGARNKFLKMWPYLLGVDQLWALAPFLLLHHINFGLALAQRSLVLMGAGGDARQSPSQIE
jgi:cholera toxin transcriptional activator